MRDNCDTFLDMYSFIMNEGQTSNPRGQEILEVENAIIRGIDSSNPFTSFRARKLNIQYACYEFFWYLKGDRFDNSIEKYAKLWRKIHDDVDNGFNSNYGQYIYKGNFFNVANTLISDPDSRQAVITLLNESHLRAGNPDVVCTYSISFRIRNGKLNMSVNMRSSDAVYGFTNDVFCFSMIHLHMLNTLKNIRKFCDLQLGDFTLKVDSLHIYKKHFEMVKTILSEGREGYYHIDMPDMTPFDASLINRLNIQDRQESKTEEVLCTLEDYAKCEGLTFVPWLVNVALRGIDSCVKGEENA